MKPNWILLKRKCLYRVMWKESRGLPHGIRKKSTSKQATSSSKSAACDSDGWCDDDGANGDRARRAHDSGDARRHGTARQWYGNDVAVGPQTAVDRTSAAVEDSLVCSSGAAVTSVTTMKKVRHASAIYICIIEAAIDGYRSANVAVDCFRCHC